MTNLFKAIFECQALKDFITITEDLADDIEISTNRVIERRGKFTTKILQQTGTLDCNLEDAKKKVNDILTIIDTTILKNCNWLVEK